MAWVRGVVGSSFNLTSGYELGGISLEASQPLHDDLKISGYAPLANERSFPSLVTRCGGCVVVPASDQSLSKSCSTVGRVLRENAHICPQMHQNQKMGMLSRWGNSLLLPLQSPTARINDRTGHFSGGRKNKTNPRVELTLDVELFVGHRR